MLTCLKSNIKRIRPKAMDLHRGCRAHGKCDCQAKLAFVSQQLATHYASQTAAPSGFYNTVYGRENRAQNQSENSLKNGLKKISGETGFKAVTQNEFNLPEFSGRAAKKRKVVFREVGH